MDKKFLSIVQIGDVVSLTLTNDKYEGTVVSIDNESNCVELSTGDGDEFVSLASLTTFKKIRIEGNTSNKGIAGNKIALSQEKSGNSNIDGIVTNNNNVTVPPKVNLSKSNDSNKYDAVQNSNKVTVPQETLNESNIDNFLIIIREKIRGSKQSSNSSEWIKIENSIRDAIKNKCFENDHDRIKRLVSLVVSLYSGMETEIPQLLTLKDYLKAGISIKLKPTSVNAVVKTKGLSLEASRIFLGQVKFFDHPRNFGFIGNTDVPKEYLRDRETIYFSGYRFDEFLKKKLDEGKKVSFTLGENEKGLIAKNVKLLCENAAATSVQPQTSNNKSLIGTRSQAPLNLDPYLQNMLSKANPAFRYKNYIPSDDYNFAANVIHFIKSEGGTIDKWLLCAKVMDDTLRKNNGRTAVGKGTSDTKINFDNKQIELLLQQHLKVLADEEFKKQKYDVAFFVYSRVMYFPQIDKTFSTRALENYAKGTLSDIVRCHIEYLIEKYQKNRLDSIYNPSPYYNIRYCREHYDDILRKLGNELISTKEDLSFFSSELKTDVHLKCLFNSEKELIKKIISALPVYMGDSFEARSSSLRTSKKQFDEIIAVINDSPTVVAYDNFLPHLVKISHNIENEIQRMHNEQPPDISIVCSEKITFNGPEKYITVSISNNETSQRAENICITSKSGIIAQDKQSEIRSLYGGNTEKREVKLLLDQVNAQELKVVDIDFVVQYEYLDISFVRIKGELVKTHPASIMRSEFHKVKNPFSGKDGQPMQDDDLFVGRFALIDKLTKSLRYNDRFNYGHIHALYGQTRSGKSSILFHSKKKICEVYKSSVIIADCGNIDSCTSSTAALLSSIAYGIIKGIKDTVDFEKDKLNKLEELEANILNKPNHAENYFKRFNDEIASISLLKDKLILLIIDEFTDIHDKIKQGKISSDFMKIWKELFQKYKYSALIAAQENIIDFRSEFPNEFGVMELEHVTYLRKEDCVTDLIEKHLSIDGKTIFDEQASKHLYELSHGSPYLTVKLCNLIAEYFNRKQLSRITKSFIDIFLEEEIYSGPQKIDITVFEPQINDRAQKEVYGDNLKLLCSVAKLTKEDGRIRFDKIAVEGLPEEQIKKLVERLTVRDVLEKNKNEYSIKVLLLKEWLLRNYE